jgi:transposase
MEIQSQGSKKEICKYCFKQRKETVKKKVEGIISRIPEGFTVAVEDESIFIHDILIRRMWTPEGKRPIVTVTGSHQKTCVFDTLTIDGKQLFRQYKTFDQDSFISYLRELKRKFHKLILFLDRAPQHCRSKRVKAYLERNNNLMIVEYLPKGSPDLSAVEECWRQGKDDLLVSKYYPRFASLKDAITNYYRTKRFNLNILKYLMRESTNLCY